MQNGNMLPLLIIIFQKYSDYFESPFIKLRVLTIKRLHHDSEINHCVIFIVMKFLLFEEFTVTS
jgi:hypothetical protein